MLRRTLSPKFRNKTLQPPSPMAAQEEQRNKSPTRSSKDGPAEMAAREFWRVASKFMPSSYSTMKALEEEAAQDERSFPQEMRRVASQVLMRPNALFQEITGGATKRRSHSQVVLEELPPKSRPRRAASEMRLRDGPKRSAAEAQLPDFGGLRHNVSGPRLVPKRADNLLHDDEPSLVMPVWQAKESDRPCLVPPLCVGTAQIEADRDFFAWANSIVQDVADDATTANFSVARVPGPPPLPPSAPVEAIAPPCAPPPWATPMLTAPFVAPVR
mmetsp:Transcript_36623/g.101699  ORF Transcript_36623/g.101699 Transcript_36623/m.101699 type:complete len:272 (-) Transcript_36623:20-835(-)